MPFTSHSAYLARQKRCGLARARFWAALGHPQLVKARAAQARYREQRKQEAARLKAQEQLRKAMESDGDW